MADWKIRMTALCAIGGIAIGAAACSGNNENSSTNNNTNGGDVGMEDDTGAETDMGDDMGEEPTLYYIAQILSVSSGPDACDVPDPGPDIFAVELTDETGATLGWGSVVHEDVQFEDNTYFSSAHLDGSAPALDGDMCVDFSEDTVVALGCEDNNYIAVEFLDGDGNPIALDATAGQTIVTHEYGGQCATGSVADEYDVNICTDTDAVKNDFDVSSCTLSLVQAGAGATNAEVTGF